MTKYIVIVTQVIGQGVQVHPALLSEKLQSCVDYALNWPEDFKVNILEDYRSHYHNPNLNILNTGHIMTVHVENTNYDFASVTSVTIHAIKET